MFPTRVRIPLMIILPTLLGGCTAAHSDSGEMVHTTENEAAAPSSKAAGHSNFGEPLRMAEKDTIALATILADKPAYDGKSVRVSGTVSAVCAKKGCWLRMVGREGGEDVFVKFTCPVDGRLIPMAAVNHRVVVDGKITMGEITEELARHYAEDTGAGPEEIAKIVGPQKQISIQSPAARVHGL